MPSRHRARRNMGRSARDIDSEFGAYDGFMAPAAPASDAAAAAPAPRGAPANGPLHEPVLCPRVCALDTLDDSNFHADIFGVGRVCGRPLLAIAVRAMRGVRAARAARSLPRPPSYLCVGLAGVCACACVPCSRMCHTRVTRRGPPQVLSRRFGIARASSTAEEDLEPSAAAATAGGGVPATRTEEDLLVAAGPSVVRCARRRVYGCVCVILCAFVVCGLASMACSVGGVALRTCDFMPWLELTPCAALAGISSTSTVGTTAGTRTTTRCTLRASFGACPRAAARCVLCAPLWWVSCHACGTHVPHLPGTCNST